MTPRSTTPATIPLPSMADHDDEPQYTVYRSRPRLPWQRKDEGIDGLREPGEKRDEEPPKRRRGWPFRRPGRPGRRRITPGRVITYVAMAIGAWLLLSLILFLVSAQIQSSKISDAADAKLSGGGYPLTSANTILVLGSD